MQLSCRRCGSGIAWGTLRCTRCAHLNGMHPMILLAKGLGMLIVGAAVWLAYVASSGDREPRARVEPMPGNAPEVIPGTTENIFHRKEEPPGDPTFSSKR